MPGKVNKGSVLLGRAFYFFPKGQDRQENDTTDVPITAHVQM